MPSRAEIGAVAAALAVHGVIAVGLVKLGAHSPSLAAAAPSRAAAAEAKTSPAPASTSAPAEKNVASAMKPMAAAALAVDSAATHPRKHLLSRPRRAAQPPIARTHEPSAKEPPAKDLSSKDPPAKDAAPSTAPAPIQTPALAPSPAPRLPTFDLHLDSTTTADAPSGKLPH